MFAVLCIMQSLLVGASNVPSKTLPAIMSSMAHPQLITHRPLLLYHSVPFQPRRTQSSLGSFGTSEDNKKTRLKPMHTQTPSSNHTASTYPVNTILVETAPQSAVNILFRSSSSSVNVLQDHRQAKSVTLQMHRREEPVRMVLNITKPVIQEVNELILPYRNIKQEIHPVKEYVHTLIKEAHDTDYSEDKQEQVVQQLEAEKSTGGVVSEDQRSEGQNEVDDGLHKLRSYISYVHGQTDMMYPTVENRPNSVLQVNGKQVDSSVGTEKHVQKSSTENGLMDDKSDLTTSYLPQGYLYNLNGASDVRVQSKVRQSETEYQARSGHEGSLEPVFRESQSTAYYQHSEAAKGETSRDGKMNASVVPPQTEQLYVNLTTLHGVN